VTGRRSNQLSYARNPKSAPQTCALSRWARLRDQGYRVKHGASRVGASAMAWALVGGERVELPTSSV
jgi:hypothetical protein